MVCWVTGPIELFLVQPDLHNLYDPVSGMVHIKDPMLLIEKSSLYSCTVGFLSRYLNGPLPERDR